MIARRNLIQLLTTGSKAAPYHSAVLTCYTFDPLFFESVYLPCLRALGITNVVVAMDATRYDALLADAAYGCHPVRLANYTLVRQENGHQGVFHPKLALLFGAKEGALLVGSGNLTFSGMSENEEVWNAFHVKGNSSPHYPLFFNAWEYVKTLERKRGDLVERQLSWIDTHTPWLGEKPLKAHAMLSSGETCWLLSNGESGGILEQLVQLIGAEPVESITVVAPFYDPAGQAVRALQTQLQPKALHCVLDPDRQHAPYGLLHDASGITFHRYTGGNPLHAKLIQVETAHGTWLVSGSANAGEKALGLTKEAYNDEVCLLLHSPVVRNYVEELGLRFSPLTEAERKQIVVPTPSVLSETAHRVKILSAEVVNGQLHLAFSQTGLAGKLAFYNRQQQQCYTHSVTTAAEVCLCFDFPEGDTTQWVVLKDKEKEISNRCLVVYETSVERANPDPTRRKLTRLLDETSVHENLSQLLDLIAFDDMPTHNASAQSLSVSGTKATKGESADVEVEKARFNALRERKMSIGLHTGLRILEFLQQVLFHTEGEEATDDQLLNQERNGQDGDADSPTLHPVTVSEAAKTKSSVMCFLNRMEDFLTQQTKKTALLDTRHPLAKEPRLVAVPRFNAASALCVAATTVTMLMNQYGTQLTKRRDVRDKFMRCAQLFCAVYSNKLPDGDDYESKKVRELLLTGTTTVLSACSFFDFSLNPTELIQTVLNALLIWKDQPEQDSVLPLWEKQRSQLASPAQHPQSLQIILSAVRLLMAHNPIPIQAFTSEEPTVFLYRKGYGFFVADQLKHKESQWSYHYRYPWFEDTISYNAQTYKGYPASVFMK